MSISEGIANSTLRISIFQTVNTILINPTKRLSDTANFKIFVKSMILQITSLVIQKLLNLFESLTTTPMHKHVYKHMKSYMAGK
jgi:hypothetical protein